MTIAKTLFTYTGRIGRSDYWLGQILVFSLATIAELIFYIATSWHGVSTIIWIVATAVAVAFYAVVLVMGLAIQVKRWHDRGRTGWMVLVLLIPVLGQIYTFVELGFLSGSKGTNRYGEHPSVGERLPTGDEIALWAGVGALFAIALIMLFH